jgi:ElaB/YqjD/DUF883 family membrane-anchored ribosome-binding protein
VPNADQLEKSAETHRAHLTDHLSALASSVNPEARAKAAVGQTTDLTETLAKAAMNGAKRNPSGLALIGIGAALIALSANKKEEATLTSYDDMGSHDDRIARADAKMQARTRAMTGRFAQTESASSLRKSLDKGLDHLSPEARARVTEARLKAIDAQEAVERHARQTSAQAREAHQSQPFLTGAVVAGIGALIGALLPSTKAEADMMGATRDKMMRDAEAVMREELGKLEQQGKSAVETGIKEARSEFADARHSA